MSCQSPLFSAIPEETATIAKAVFLKGHRYLRLRDALGPLFSSADFHQFYHREGRPAVDPARLALVTILQFAERLSDQQAADAVRSRIDWKYLLALPLADPGFDASVLSEFRARLIAHQAEEQLFELLLGQFREYGLLRARGRQRTDSTHVLAAVRALNRLECVAVTLRHALNSLAVVAPAWLLSHTPASWAERYGPRIEDSRLPESKDERLQLATTIGADGLLILQSVAAPTAAAWLRQIPAVETLRQVWIQNYTWADQRTLRWRANEETPPAGQYISSPYDTQARYCLKRSTSWEGYKIHLTESCDDDLPHLITNVETTTATTADDAVTPIIHARLAQRALLPAVHLADTGFIDAELILESEQQYQLDLLGPVRGDYKWQAQAGEGFAAQDFTIDWEAQHAICPAGQQSISWTPAIDRGRNAVVKIKFSQRDCQACPVHEKCTKSRRRTITVRPEAQHRVLMQRRQRQKTKAFKRDYAKRSGVEGCMSQSVRRCDVRQARYRGLAKTRLQHLATAAALNLLRVSDWLDERPRAQTRQTRFERLFAMQGQRPAAT